MIGWGGPSVWSMCLELARLSWRGLLLAALLIAACVMLVACGDEPGTEEPTKLEYVESYLMAFCERVDACAEPVLSDCQYDYHIEAICEEVDCDATMDRAIADPLLDICLEDLAAIDCPRSGTLSCADLVLL